MPYLTICYKIIFLSTDSGVKIAQLIYMKFIISREKGRTMKLRTVIFLTLIAFCLGGNAMAFSYSYAALNGVSSTPYDGDNNTSTGELPRRYWLSALSRYLWCHWWRRV